MALLVVQIAFASQAVEAKLAMLPRSAGGEEIRPEVLAIIRMIGGALFFQALQTVQPFLSRSPGTLASSATSPRLSLATHGKLVGLATLGVAVNQALFLAGLRASTPFVVSLLGATIPVFTAGLAVLFRKERASWRTAAGLVLALSGALWLAGVGSGAHGESDLGALLVTLNCLSYAAYVVFSRAVVVEVGAIRFMAWVFTYGALLFAVLGIPALVHEVSVITPRGWAFLAYIVAIPTIVAYGLHAWALSRSSATTVTIYIYLQPILAAILARVQLGYAISSRAGLAAVLILAGVAVTTSRRARA